MPRARSPEQSHLPKRWLLEHGQYFYRVPPGQEDHWDGKKKFPLGRTLPDAYEAFGRRCRHIAEARTIGELLDRYALQVIPLKAPKTRTSNFAALSGLRSVFGRLPLDAIKPRHVYQYHDLRSQKVDGKGGPTIAKREIEVLSHVFTKAVEWGLIDRHPFKSEVRLTGEAPRTRFLEDWEVTAMLSIKSRRKAGSVRMVQAFIRLKLLTGLRRSDLLRLTASHIRDDGIHITPGKTKNSSGKRQIFAWTIDGQDTGRRAALDECIASRPCLSPFVFCNRDGVGYLDEETGTSDGFDSVWQRFVDRVIAETNVVERFTDSDLRAKAGTEQESLEKARALLGHSETRTTRRHYMRKPEVV